jgi:paraquat-inducible protein A
MHPRLAPGPPAPMPCPERLLACRTCGLTQRVAQTAENEVAVCGRCGSLLSTSGLQSLTRTLAFSLAALICYLPANLYPILHMQWYGMYSENTVWQGVVKLFQDGQWLVATIVFLASILVPLLKLIGLFYLSGAAKLKSPQRRRERTWIYKTIVVMGPWAMLDVFLLATLVALVKLGQFATVLPGPGLLAFTAVVVFSLLASSSFDPRLIWEDSEPGRTESGHDPAP